MAPSHALVDAEPDGSGRNDSVPALTGCITWGGTMDDATELVRTAIQSRIAALRDLGQEIPQEGVPPVVLAVEIDLSAA